MMLRASQLPLLKLIRGEYLIPMTQFTALKEIEPEAEFFFIIGADMVDLLPTWHKIDELVRLVTFIGVNRPGSLGETTYPVKFISIPEIDLSSTVLRARLSEGGTIRFLTPPMWNHLYVRRACMDLAQLKTEVSKRLSTGRYNHVLRVTGNSKDV